MVEEPDQAQNYSNSVTYCLPYGHERQQTKWDHDGESYVSLQSTTVDWLIMVFVAAPNSLLLELVGEASEEPVVT